MSNGLEDGRKLRNLNIIDDYNREALATEGGLSFSSARVTRVLDRLAFEHGCPEKLRVDNGPEYTAKELKMYCEDINIELVLYFSESRTRTDLSNVSTVLSEKT